MAVNQEKQRFVQQMQATITMLARVNNELADFFRTSQVRGYGANGSDPITDGDIVDTQVSAAEVNAALTLAENLPKFLSNQSPFASDYQPAIAALRTDM